MLVALWISFSLSFGSTQSDLRFESYARFRERIRNRKLGIWKLAWPSGSDRTRSDSSLRRSIALDGFGRTLTRFGSGGMEQSDPLRIGSSQEHKVFGLKTPTRFGSDNRTDPPYTLHWSATTLRIEDTKSVRIGSPNWPALHQMYSNTSRLRL